MEDKIKVHFINPCYECHVTLSNPSTVLKHLKNDHGIEIDGRQPIQKRPTSKAYTYQKDYTNDCVIHFACPSCWFHCSEDFDIFSRHVIENHVYPAANIYTTKNGGYGSKIATEDEVDSKIIIKESEPIIKNKGKKPITSTAGTSQEAAKKKEDEILGTLDELVLNFKKLFSSRKEVN
jgi:hypothetical protein